MGKSLQPLNAMAVRPPANTSAAHSGAEPVTAESLGWQLRAALPPLRLHSVSLYDEEANVLWLSEGALGPDEHSLVLEAMDTLANDRALPCCENGLEDGRVAIFLPVRAPQGELVGVAMILADLKSVGDGVLERIVSPQVRTIMQKVAVLLRANGKGMPAAEPPAPVPAPIASVVELAPERAPTSARSANPASHAATQPAPAPTATPSVGARSSPAAAPKPATNIRPTVAAAPSSSAAAAAVAPQMLAAAAAPTAALAARPSGPSVTTPASGGDPELSPQAVDDILEFEVFPDIAAAAPARPASPPSAAPQPTSLEWDAPVASASIDAAPVAEVQAASATPASIAPPSAKVSSPPGGHSDPLATTTEVALDLQTASPPVLSPPASASPTVNTTPSAAQPKTSTTTTRALSPPAASAEHPALNGTSASPTQAPNVAATGSAKVLALDPASIILDIQAFSKLRTGGRARRYEVLPRMPHRDANRGPAATDGLALQRLLSWLGANRAAWSLEPTSFSLNLSISTLEDPRFPQHVASCLKANGIAPDNLGFEIAEALCTQHRAQVERFMSLCDKLGCFVVIDDFSLDSSVFPLLRSKALRLVKIDPKLTSAAQRDKLSQAMVVAIVQAVKVLGIHCAAKRVESQASLQWLTGIGCDLAQGPALCQVLPIESLNMPQTPAADPSKTS